MKPSFFDAPAATARLLRWTAHAYLTASPNALMTKEVRPVCGFSWGYSRRGRIPEALPLHVIREEAWLADRDVLSERYPAWRFGPWWSEEGA